MILEHDHWKDTHVSRKCSQHCADIIIKFVYQMKARLPISADDYQGAFTKSAYWCLLQDRTQSTFS